MPCIAEMAGHPRAAVAIGVALLAAGCNGGGNPAAGAGDGEGAAEKPMGGAGPAWFVEEASARGIDFVWRSGHEQKHYMPEITGGGAALFDMDNDGDLDLYLVQGGSAAAIGGAASTSNPPNQLYRNDGAGNFENVTEGSGAGDQGYGMGVACGDYDGDGDTDLYITNVGPNVLLQNNGSGVFTDVTTSAATGDETWSTAAAFFDYDLDGDLDLYVCNYLYWSPATELTCYNSRGAQDYCLPANYRAQARDTLYRNEGDGTFADVTDQAGLGTRFGPGLGVVCGDFNGDNRPDVFIANDGMYDQLWANQGNGTFMDVGMLTGCALDHEGKAKAGMGVTAADLDDDGDLDVMVCNLDGESDSIYINQDSFFEDRTTAAGVRPVSRPFTRFGLAWVDLDNDGYLDLYEANGRVMTPDALDVDDPFAEPNLLFAGAAGGVFDEVHPRGGTGAALVHTSRAAAFGDIDNDGGIDIVVVNRDAPAYVLHNVVPDRGRWIMLAVLDHTGSHAVGATVKLVLGDRIVTRDVRAAYSYLASNDPRIHVGLGDAAEVHDVQVRWPDGTIEVFGTLEADRIHTLRQTPNSGGD